MRGFSKKMLISILTSVVVFVTMIATTFAWVGIFTYANTDKFNLNLKVVDVDANYYLTISSTGKNGSFSDSVNEIDIKRSILKNQLEKDSLIDFDAQSDSIISSYFEKYATLNPCTPIMEKENIQSFQKIDLYNAGSLSFIPTIKDYYSFDLYISVDSKEGINLETTEINSNVYLSNIKDCIEGTISKYKLINDNYYTDLVLPSTSDPLYERTRLLKEMPQQIKLDSKNAVRFALELYNPINIDSNYTDEIKPIKTTIYQGGTQEPLYDSKTDVYCLGGCLPEDYNTAIKDLLSIRPSYVGTPGYYSRELYLNSISKACERNDLELSEENNLIWKKNFNIEDNPFLGVHNGVQTKLRIKVYFWFEGWDSDCIKGIDHTMSSLNLTFTSGTDE